MDQKENINQPVPVEDSKAIESDVEETKVSEPNAKVIGGDDVFKAMTEAFEKKISVPLITLNETLAKFVEMQAANKDLLISLAKEANKSDKLDWVEQVHMGSERSAYNNDSLLSTVRRKDSEFGQYFEHEGERFRATKPSFGSSNSGEKLTGEKALVKVMGALGLGSVVQIPLIHSGVWVSIKAPSASDLFILDRRIAEIKSVLGQTTFGLIFSNTSVYIAEYVIDFIIDHIYETNIKDFKPDTFRNTVLMNDIPSLIWGLACTIYPSGYPLKQPCIADVNNCRHVTEVLLNLGKIQWFDRTRISSSMSKFMSDKYKKYSTEEFLNYQTHVESETIDIGRGITLTLKAPTIREFINSGHKWIDSIHSLIDKSFDTTLEDDVRDEYIGKQSMLTTLRQYGHWVKRITINGEVIDDKDTIDTVISEFSSDLEIVGFTIERILKYVDDSTICVIAIPRTKCPQCGAPHSKELDKHPELMPIDPMNIFFTLVIQRLLQTHLTGE